MSKVLRRYGLNGSFSSSTSAVETFTAVRDGVLKGIVLSVSFAGSTTWVAGASIAKNTATTTVTQLGLTTNLVDLVSRCNLVTSGGMSDNRIAFIPCNDKVAIGDKFYIHGMVTSGTVTGNVTAILVVEEAA